MPRVKKHMVIRPAMLVGIDLIVTYKGLDPTKKLLVSRALGKYETGTGMAFQTGIYDHSATVPKPELAGVLRTLKKIRGINTHRLVKKWVRCR
jgi:hypothetical protein